VTSKQRVQAALQRQPVDRIPVFMWFHPDTTRRLARLRGLTDMLTDMAAEPALAQELFRRCADFAVGLSREACRRFPLDWLWAGDDVASQSGLMMSPAMWREMVKPELKRVFDVGRGHGIPNAYHCCGALRPIIPDLIEIGMDVLNPVQCNCPGMEPLELKRAFGTRVAFMGGGLPPAHPSQPAMHPPSSRLTCQNACRKRGSPVTLPPISLWTLC